MATTITGNTIDVNTAVLNRLSTDGTIVDLQKDGTSVGSIGSFTGDNLTIGTGAVGVRFDVGLSDIIPHNVTTNVNQDATINLGHSEVRFNDLYLSGGVYLGGTGAANKLEDYEEGAFLPFVQATGDNCTGLSFTLGYYTKIGRLVNLSFNVWGTITSASAETNIKFALPFSAINSGNQAAGGSANFYMGTGTDRFSVGAIWNGSGEYTSSHIYIPASAMNASGAISGMAVSMTYLTP